MVILGCFQPSVAQASSEGWFRRVLDRRVRFFFGLTPPLMTSQHGLLLAAEHQASSYSVARASPRLGRVPQLPATDGTAVQHQRTQDGGANRQDLRALSKQGCGLKPRDDAHAHRAAPESLRQRSVAQRSSAAPRATMDKGSAGASTSSSNGEERISAVVTEGQLPVHVYQRRAPSAGTSAGTQRHKNVPRSGALNVDAAT